MASLQELLTEEAFARGNFLKTQKKVKFRDKVASNDSIALPIYICHDRKSSDFSKQKAERASSRNGSSVVSSKRGVSESGRSIMIDGPAIDEVAVKAIISILSGYVGQYIRNDNFFEIMKEKCYSYFVGKKKDYDGGMLSNLELGIQSVEKLLDGERTKKELNIDSLQNSIRFFSVVASLDSQSKRNGSTCEEASDSELSACAHLYLSIVHKLEKNDRISAGNLLQVFCDSPFLARTHLLPDLWEHFFLPHLLHLKIWHNRELEFISSSGYADRERKMKALSKVYNDQMDRGTTQFALYYKEWLKVGAEAPPIPSVPLSSRPSYGSSRRRSSDSFQSYSSINKSLYRTALSHKLERRSTDLGKTRPSINLWGLEEMEKRCADEDNIKCCSYNEVMKNGSHTRLLSQYQIKRRPKAELLPENQKSDYFPFLSCGSEPAECLVHANPVITNGSVEKAKSDHLIPSNDLTSLITTLCSSERVSDCEMAIREIANVWLDSHGDSIVEASLSQAQIIEGMLEVLYASKDDEVLELAISILAELVTRKEVNGLIVLNSDPQLDTFITLLRNSSLFVKAAALLYLLDQLITGFDEDKNFENARQVILLGGLSLLVRRMEIGDFSEKSKVASIIHYCIQADGSCRHYLVNNLNKDALLQLLVLEKHRNLHGHAFVLLLELLCLHRRSQALRILSGLMSGWNCLNTIHIFLVYLEKAQPEERPMIAAILLQLDLLGDPLKCSVYREEAIEAIITAMDCQVCYEKIQERSARALLMLGGCFSYTGESTTEKWLLKEAGLNERSGDKFHGRDIFNEYIHMNEEKAATKCWQRKVATVLFTSGNKKFLFALSDSICNGIPFLARASLVTLAWMSSCLPSVGVGDESLCYLTCSILVPTLIETLNQDKTLEERVLASLSLLNLVKTSDYASKFCRLNKELIGNLQKLSLVTWTAGELTSIIKSCSKHDYILSESSTS